MNLGRAASHSPPHRPAGQCVWRAREVCFPGRLSVSPRKCPADVCLSSREQGGPHPGCSEARCSRHSGRWDRQGRPGAPRWPMGLCRPASPISFSLRPIRSLSLSPHRRWSLTDAWQPRLRHRAGLWQTWTQSSRNTQEVPPGSEVTAPSERGLTASTESQGAETPCARQTPPGGRPSGITTLPAKALSTEALFLAAQTGSLPNGLPREKG